MQKLNKNGWSLNVMIAFICLFVFCLLLTSFFVYKSKLFGSPTNTPGYVSSSSYHNQTSNNGESMWESLFGQNKTTDYGMLQVGLMNAAKRYVKDAYNNQLGIDTLIVTSSNLIKKNYLTQFKDANGRNCTGYVEASYNNNNQIDWKSFIKCKKYETSGYEERKDVKA